MWKGHGMGGQLESQVEERRALGIPTITVTARAAAQYLPDEPGRACGQELFDLGATDDVRIASVRPSDTAGGAADIVSTGAAETRESGRVLRAPAVSSVCGKASM